jgi:hypothetical protein
MSHSTAQHEMDRHAYNAAFHDLGLRWHWDSDTYARLLERSPVAGERLRAYLESDQAHLLRAYDPQFLVDAIERRKAHFDRVGTTSGAASRLRCNWAAIQAGQVGA